jgi:hypothetical protein
MISTSCSGANCIRISRSSSRGRFFSIIVIFRQEYHTCQYPQTWILTTTMPIDVG